MAHATSKRRAFDLLPITQRLLFIVGLFVLIVACLVFLTNARMEIQSAVRAYVGGEGLWSKGQKDAVHYLTRYARSHVEDDYQHYLNALAIPLGDQQARLELEKPDPDLAVVYKGFIQGRNHPDDVENMAWLFRRFRHIGYMARAIAIWAEGDASITELRRRGAELHAAITSEQADSAGLDAILEQINVLNRGLTSLEDQFSNTLGEANRWVTRVLWRINAAATILLLGMGLLLSWLLLRQMQAAEEAQQRSSRQLQEEARISTGLARVGHELIASLDTSAILDRLCQLTTELLDCDCSHTVLANSDEDVFVPVAGYGDSPEHWESMRMLKIPRLALASVLAHFERDEIVHETFLAASHETAMVRIPEAWGITAAMAVALRRGDAIIGYLDAAYRGRPVAFSSAQERLLRGVASLASLALANAQLLEELERVNRFRSEFMANMSHELRSPLHVIIGYSDLLHEGSYGDLTPKQTEIAQRTGDRARELLALINATLDLSRLEAQRVPLVAQEVHLPTLIDELASDFRALPQKADLHLVFDVPANLPPLCTDPLKLTMVLKNLVGNAIKFTDRGQVTVGARADDGRVEITVADTGIGIAPEAVPFIFDAFRQADNSTTRRHGGVGLGLYITRRLLDVLGGTITVDSEVGCGSTFRIALPLNGANDGNGEHQQTRPAPA